MDSPEITDGQPLVITSSLERSPVAMKVFLDALAELIACAILEELTQNTDETPPARRATPAVP